MSETAIVVGGGLAGLAAGCELADAGLRVTLLEKRPFLGGRTYSYVDKRTGLEVDNGQHVFLGCCTEYMRFLKRLGVWHKAHLQKRMRVRVIDKVWGESLLESDALPAPLHLLPSLLRFRSLSPLEKARAIYALGRVRSLDRSKQTELDDVAFCDWLRRHGQTENAIRSLWNLIIQPTLNDDVTKVSADLALMVFQEGFLRSRDGANVGWAKVGLSALLAGAAARYIESRGGEVLLGGAAEAVIVDGGAAAALEADGGTMTADHYILALPPRETLAVLPNWLRGDAFFAHIGRIESSPIVNVHLWYDRPVWDGDFAAFLNTPLQWAFNKSKLWGQEGDGQYIDISLSGAREFAEMPSRQVIELFRREVQALMPAARGAVLRRTLVVKQPEATFAPRPGVGRLRPRQRTPIAGLFLAGDWTDTGWPATMESAVRSGLLAAGALLRSSARETSRREVVQVK